MAVDVDVSSLLGLRDAVQVALDRLHDEADEHDVAAARMALRDAFNGGSFLQGENEILKRRLEAYREAWALTSIRTKQTVFACFDGGKLDVRGLIHEDVLEAWGSAENKEQG